MLQSEYVVKKRWGNKELEGILFLTAKIAVQPRNFECPKTHFHIAQSPHSLCP